MFQHQYEFQNKLSKIVRAADVSWKTFSTLSKTNWKFSVIFVLSLANAFNLDHFKFCFFSKGLNEGSEKALLKYMYLHPECFPCLKVSRFQKNYISQVLFTFLCDLFDRRDR